MKNFVITAYQNNEYNKGEIRTQSMAGEQGAAQGKHGKRLWKDVDCIVHKRKCPIYSKYLVDNVHLTLENHKDSPMSVEASKQSDGTIAYQKIHSV